MLGGEKQSLLAIALAATASAIASIAVRRRVARRDADSESQRLLCLVKSRPIVQNYVHPQFGEESGPSASRQSRVSSGSGVSQGADAVTVPERSPPKGVQTEVSITRTLSSGSYRQEQASSHVLVPRHANPHQNTAAGGGDSIQSTRAGSLVMDCGVAYVRDSRQLTESSSALAATAPLPMDRISARAPLGGGTGTALLARQGTSTDRNMDSLLAKKVICRQPPEGPQYRVAAASGAGSSARFTRIPRGARRRRARAVPGGVEPLSIAAGQEEMETAPSRTTPPQKPAVLGRQAVARAIAFLQTKGGSRAAFAARRHIFGAFQRWSDVASRLLRRGVREVECLWMTRHVCVEAVRHCTATAPSSSEGVLAVFDAVVELCRMDQSPATTGTVGWEGEAAPLGRSSVLEAGGVAGDSREIVLACPGLAPASVLDVEAAVHRLLASRAARCRATVGLGPLGFVVFATAVGLGDAEATSVVDTPAGYHRLLKEFYAKL